MLHVLVDEKLFSFAKKKKETRLLYAYCTHQSESLDELSEKRHIRRLNIYRSITECGKRNDYAKIK